MISIVKGDVFEFDVEVEDVDLTYIDKVTLHIPKLNIKEEATFINEVYKIRIEGNVTREFPVGFFNYSLIITFTDGEEYTALTDEKLEVVLRRETKDASES